ncbi:DNA-binding winged helix-turn-helix (wHTH) protein/tetratricopeptide (TPR) repeat protein [Sphingomonas kaistensis]|uniref:DNA-binding winged helix-turn-helix (WHTH) protein/tetratricopeptide (TPR) repeat protein n=1 Tax=Sphingomonas kaistensis TaxID=298708 RepID=A0A7X5Y3M8_9SPHN|nr:tetratricopeptide repeat protein [Sphingomonas kaistensis]NJC04589.1 DNA-binding winged helix-turn-helix (wHTH) protein/tetratricopeptide (TPR) repeat protein [Sphingomonas kaistensis]
MLKLSDLPTRDDFRIGDLRISPSRRLVEGPNGTHHVEPQFMLVFLRLLDAEGQVVTRRELFVECWGSASVGDDSLNRAIAGVRQIARAVGSLAISLETIPRTGYVLRRSSGASTPVDAASGLPEAVDDAFGCWRAGLPGPDLDVIARLDRCLQDERGSARGWGMKAVLLRKAVEYSPPNACSDLLTACEAAARRALAIDPWQSDALVARAGVMPMFGNWLAVRKRLEEVLDHDPGHMPARHDLAVLEMATGRPSAARPLIAALIDEDPLAATFYYKRMYHCWNFGELEEMERVATRALQLWPQHPAIWSARFWTLLFTGRAEQARCFVQDEYVRPALPPVMVTLLGDLAALCGGSADDEKRCALVERAAGLVVRAPVMAVAALMALLALGEAPRVLDLAYSYYLGRGSQVTPLWSNADDARISDQYRRITQLLFLPCASELRALAGFEDLCRDLGFSAYWQGAGLQPDFRS